MDLWSADRDYVEERRVFALQHRHDTGLTRNPFKVVLIGQHYLDWLILVFAEWHNFSVVLHFVFSLELVCGRSLRRGRQTRRHHPELRNDGSATSDASDRRRNWNEARGEMDKGTETLFPTVRAEGSRQLLLQCLCCSYFY